MRRILVMYWPKVRRTTGSSLGPNTISATMPMRTSSPQPTSKMKACTPRDALTSRLAAHALLCSRALLGSAWAVSARLAALGLCNRFRRLMLDRLAGLGALGLARRLVLFLHAFLEGLDALGHVTHQLGDLAPAEQQKQDGNHDDPVPNAQAAHGISSVTAIARRATRLVHRQARRRGRQKQGFRPPSSRDRSARCVDCRALFTPRSLGARGRDRDRRARAAPRPPAGSDRPRAPEPQSPPAAGRRAARCP